MTQKSNFTPDLMVPLTKCTYWYISNVNDKAPILSKAWLWPQMFRQSKAVGRPHRHSSERKLCHYLLFLISMERWQVRARSDHQRPHAPAASHSSVNSRLVHKHTLLLLLQLYSSKRGLQQTFLVHFSSRKKNPFVRACEQVTINALLMWFLLLYEGTSWAVLRLDWLLVTWNGDEGKGKLCLSCMQLFF